MSGLKELRCNSTALCGEALRRMARFSPLLKILSINGRCFTENDNTDFDLQDFKRFEHLEELHFVQLAALTDKDIRTLIAHSPPRLFNLYITDCSKISCSSLFALAAAPPTMRLSRLEFRHIGLYAGFEAELVLEATKALLHRNHLYFLKIVSHNLVGNLQQQLQKYLSDTVCRPSHLPSCEIVIS